MQMIRYSIHIMGITKKLQLVRPPLVDASLTNESDFMIAVLMSLFLCSCAEEFIKSSKLQLRTVLV